jgi:hypothetical protein
VNELENALRELEIEWPATPDLAAAVTARIAAGAAPRRRFDAPARTWRARLAYLAAALVLLGGGTLAASPEARSTVLRWLGLESVEIRREPPRPVVGRALDLGTPIALPRGARVPSVLGEPDTVYATPLPDGTRAVSLVYAGPPMLLVQTFRARATPFIQKSVGSADDVENLDVDGARAYWITGAHGFAYESPSGFGYEDQRLSDRVLLVERDGLLVRVEGAISRDRAVEIARSLF